MLPEMRHLRIEVGPVTAEYTLGNLHLNIPGINTILLRQTDNLLIGILIPEMYSGKINRDGNQRTALLFPLGQEP